MYVDIGATWLAASAQRTRCNTEGKALMLTRTFEVLARCIASRSERTSATPPRDVPSSGWARASMACAGPTCPARTAPVRHSAYYSIVQASVPAVRRSSRTPCGRLTPSVRAFMGPRSYGRPERVGLY